jgi:hypothetical protein
MKGVSSSVRQGGGQFLVSLDSIAGRNAGGGRCAGAKEPCHEIWPKIEGGRELCGGYSFYRHRLPLLGRRGERVGSLAQNGEISPVTEHAPPFAPGDFLHNAEPLQVSERSIDCWG